MTELRYTTGRNVLLAAETVLLLGPAQCLTRTRLPALFGNATDQLAQRLAAGLKPGDAGATAASLCAGKPARLLVAALPDSVSRHNCPARPEAVFRQTSDAKLRDGAAIVVIVEEPAHLLPILNAIGRAFPYFSRRTAESLPARITVLPIDPRGRPLSVPAEVVLTVEAARQAARLVDMPPTELHPAALATEARRQLRGIAGVRIREVRGNALLAAGLGGIHAVGRCALVPPRMLVAQWEGSRKRTPRIALVGKGITYDTGGLHLKARGMMETMKADMGGAAAVLGAFRVLTRERHAGPLSLVLCLAENAIGPRAYKPDDILQLHSGKTVEINNTDAEGRLLLADGVSYAARILGAKTILDAATLTGAQLVATGEVHAAVVANDARLERVLVEAGRKTGDLTHPLLFAPELYKQEFKSPVADMRNSVKNRNNAQTSCAAQFIHWHIEDQGVHWGHVDLAGPAHRADRGTGYGVALLSETVRSLARAAGAG